MGASNEASDGSFWGEIPLELGKSDVDVEDSCPLSDTVLIFSVMDSKVILRCSGSEIGLIRPAKFRPSLSRSHTTRV